MGFILFHFYFLLMGFTCSRELVLSGRMMGVFYPTAVFIINCQLMFINVRMCLFIGGIGQGIWVQ
ncbi:hypothetical protein V8C40DRAFT_240419 [Trichoderma camerunense]